MAEKYEAASVIPDDLRTGIQLENIFMPHFRRKREAAFDVEPGCIDTDRYAQFVHYTSAEAALNIIQSKRVWMRKTSCMSDFGEVEHGFRVLKSCFDGKAEEFIQALDRCAPGAAQEAIEKFNTRFLDSVRSSTYITSISEHYPHEAGHGRLSMWRAFGGDTGRVAIIFKMPWQSQRMRDGIAALNLRVSPVCYQNDIEDELKEVIANITNNCEFLVSVGRDIIINTVCSMFLYNTVCVKHSGFREEREWRLMYFPYLYGTSQLMDAEIRVIGGIPQKIHKLPIDISVAPVLAELDLSNIIDHVIIGPTQYPWPMYEAFGEAMSAAGVQDAFKRVVVSDIPIRT